MADLDNDLDQPVDGDDTSPQKPVEPKGPDLEAIVRGVVEKTIGSELDSRISGLQSSMDKRLAALAKELKSVGLTQEQQDELLAQEQNKEQAKALQIAELVRRRKNAPEAVDFFIELMESADLDEQLRYIQSKLAPQAAKPAPATPASGDAAGGAPVPDSDPNNPASRRNPALESGEEMNDELADKVLSSVGRGQFRGLFSRG